MPKLLRLKKGREKSVQNRHPWIFSGAVQDMPSAEKGEWIAVHSFDHQWLGYGFFDPESQIIVRLVEFSDPTADLNTFQYWDKKIKEAFAFRKKYVFNTSTNCFRLIHAEGDFFPGLIIDVYDSVAVIQLLIQGTERLKEFIVKSLQDLGLSYVYVKNKMSPQFLEGVKTPNGWLTNPPPSSIITVKENNLLFNVDVEKGQKTGFFIDQRDNRNLVQAYSKNASVLNTFSYTGGFSVYALAGGARQVHSVDISESACQGCNENIKLNFGGSTHHEAIAKDSFDFLRETNELYQLIILDPPAFAKNARSVPNAARGYKDLNYQCFKKIDKGGIVFTFSCSQNIDKTLFRKIVFSAAADAKKNVQVLHQLTQPIDHPISIYHPEGEYLKGLVLRVE